MIDKLLSYVSLVCFYASLVCVAAAAISGEIIIADRLLSDGVLLQIVQIAQIVEVAP
jgi:hypothetical protein